MGRGRMEWREGGRRDGREGEDGEGGRRRIKEERQRWERKEKHSQQRERRKIHHKMLCKSVPFASREFSPGVTKLIFITTCTGTRNRTGFTKQPPQPSLLLH